MSPRVRRWLVPGIPFLVSLALSAATVGDHVFWQDSGFYLVAVKNFEVLYPHGFVLYLALCKAWTWLLFFVDFTLAVHLFSSFCAALAAGTIAVAARDLLKAKGPMFAVNTGDPGEMADWIGAAAGCMAAGGYTLWFTAIYAKGYALYYFILALLLWRMIRASETGERREFTWVAALIGLSWAAHPSAALLGPAFLAFVIAYRRAVGGRGLAWRTALAAVLAIGPTMFLPFIAARGSSYSMGNPSDLREFLRYLVGSAYLSRPGVIGWTESRAVSFGQYLWEELQGFGMAALTAGLITLALRRRLKLLFGIILWVVPFALATILFKMEGQQDCWFLAGWMPLYLVIAVGIQAIMLRIGTYAKPALAGIVLASLSWAAALNGPLINQRRYDLAEVYGRIHLDNLDRDAVLLVASDDAGAICSYLQSVRKIRPDVVLVLAARLGLSTASGEYWYLERLIRDNPFLKRPDLEGTRRKVGEFFDATHAAAAFLNENLDGGRPLFTAILPSSRVARRDLSIVPAGALWKVVPQGREHPDLRYWRQPISAADVLPRYRRERGQIVTHSQHDTEVKPEAYEHRLFKLLVQSQIFLARLKMSWGDHGAAAEILRKVVDLSPETRQNGELLCALGRANYGLGEIDAAERLFLEVLRTSSDPGPAAESFLFLGWIHRKRGNESEAQRCWKFALQVEGIEPRLREEIEKAVRRP